jgi:hypothetical protein
MGPDDAPTIPVVMKCGCVKCLKSFRIRAGQASVVEKEEGPKSPPLNDLMKEAGVFYASEERGWRK